MNTVVTGLNGIVARHPLGVALLCDDKAVSYRDLAARVANAADAIDRRYQLMRGRPAGPGDLVGLSMDKSTDLYVALLAIISTGAAYVPIDPGLSSDEISHIVKSTGCCLIFSAEHYRSRYTSVEIVTSEECASPSKLDVQLLPERCTEHDVCYTIFTSGSSGKPKGVRVSHANVLNLARWVAEEFSLSAQSRVLQYSTTSFDASVLDIFPTLLAGGCLCIPTEDQRLSDIELAGFCARHGVDHGQLDPSAAVIRLFERLGWVRDVRWPAPDRIAARRV